MIPHEFPDLYSAIILGTTRSPGVVTITGHDRKKSWDIQAPKGSTGASSKLNSDPIGEFQASFYLAADGSDEEGHDDFTRWESFARLIQSTTSGPTPVALSIYHPDLAARGFTEVSQGMIGGMQHDGRGGATVVVRFIEYKPPKKRASAKAAKAKPGGSEAGAPSTKPDPNADAKRELDELLAEASKP